MGTMMCLSVTSLPDAIATAHTFQSMAGEALSIRGCKLLKCGTDVGVRSAGSAGSGPGSGQP